LIFHCVLELAAFLEDGDPPAAQESPRVIERRPLAMTQEQAQLISLWAVGRPPLRTAMNGNLVLDRATDGEGCPNW
jgi:hypothetical protein